MISYRAPSYGQFKTKVTPQYWYGIPRNVELGGLTMDVDLMMNYQVDESNDYDKFLAYNRAQGARMSAMEHLVPEQMFSTEDNPAHGISAVKALQIASAEGQRIWTITSENVDVAVNNLTLPDGIISEIRNSAAAGMEITAHEQPVNFYGSSQVGYIILDPQTGAGAYKIGGGENGGYLEFVSTQYGVLGTFVELMQFFYKTPFLSKLMGTIVGPVGEIMGILATAIKISEKCKNNPLAMHVLIFLEVFLMTFVAVLFFFLATATTILAFAMIFIIKWLMSTFFQIVESISTTIFCDRRWYEGVVREVA
jgi:hypothetical protein